MSCRVFSEMMSSKLDGVLSPERTVEMDRHLDRCPYCRKRWESLQLMSTRLAASPPFAPPPDFTAKVLSRLLADRNSM